MRSRDDAVTRQPLQDTSMHFRLNRLLQSNGVLAVTVPLMAIFLFLAGCYVVHAGTDFFKQLQQAGLTSDFSEVWQLRQAVAFQESFGTLYLIWGIVVLALMGSYIYQVKMSYGDLNRGQHGKERFATLDELKKQYQAVPEKGKSFSGYGGVPVARNGKSILIDSKQSVNTLIIGLTRSGKGEICSFPMIDLYSRAKKQCSMMITDPKLELAAASILTLQARGYECHILNLVDPLLSMGYNPLSLIVDAYKEKDYASAEMICGFLAFTIYHDDAAKDPFWNRQAANVLGSLVLAHVDDALRMDALENAQAEMLFYCRQRDFLELKPENQQKVRAAMAIGEEQFMEERQVLLEEETRLKALLEQQGGDVSELEQQLEQNRKSLVHTSRQIMYTQRYVLPEEVFQRSDRHEKCINIASIYSCFLTLATRIVDQKTGKTELDNYFDNRPPMDRARLKYAAIRLSADKTKASIFSVALERLELFAAMPFAKMTAESTLNMRDVGFGKKPIAVFLAAPDFDQSFHFLASIFIRQMYYVLAKAATLERGGKCTRRVSFLLDEFGNLPAIENMSNIITVCLGRDIQFTLIVQSFEQLHKLYGDDDGTIIGNCANQLFVMSNDDKTAEKYSKLLGNKTIVEVSRDGDKMSMKKHFHESTMSRPLLDPNELMRLRRGEMVVNRSMLREDLKGKDMDPYPIFNTGENKMVYRYEYLLEDFPAGRMITDIPNLETRERIREKERVLDIDAVIAELQGTRKNDQVEHTSRMLRESNIFSYVVRELDGLLAKRELEEMTCHAILIELELEHKQDLPKEKRMRLYDALVSGIVPKEEH